jgi:hypothetical protein
MINYNAGHILIHKFRIAQMKTPGFVGFKSWALKQELQTTPVLTLSNAHDKFILDTDTSDTAIGAELLQIQNGEELCTVCQFLV